MRRGIATISLLSLLVLMEAVAWFIIKNNEVPQDGSRSDAENGEVMRKADESASVSQALDDSGDEVVVPEGKPSPLSDSEGFPPPIVEVRNGRTERTIHMGVRQYAWDPSVLEVKKGELVRLIVHNADVQHGLVIPELGVLNIDIPSDGAVIEFTPEKAGTFRFFCSYYCGDGHGIMQGKIIVEE